MAGRGLWIWSTSEWLLFLYLGIFSMNLHAFVCTKKMFIYTHLTLGEIVVRYKSLLLLCMAVVRGQFVGVASCAQQGCYLWRHKFKLIGNQFQMKLCEALTVTLRLCRFI